MVSRLLHWGPALALFITVVISWSSFMCIVEYWPVTSTATLLNFLLYILLNILTFYNFFQAVFVGPGYVPLGWKPVSIKLLLRAFCIWCNMYSDQCINAQNPLHTFSQNFPVDGEAANLLATSRCNGICETTLHNGLLPAPTCCGLVTEKSPTCYGLAMRKLV